MNNCTFRAACWCPEGPKDIFIKNGPKVEGQTAEEVKRQLHENRSHLVLHVNGVQQNVWDLEDSIIVYTPYKPLEQQTPKEKGIVV